MTRSEVGVKGQGSGVKGGMGERRSPLQLACRPVKGKLLFAYGAIYPMPWPWWAKKDGKHNGGDYECYQEPVLAADGGQVIKVGFEVGGYGKYVRMKHAGGFVTLYAHLSMVKVAAGEKLQAGAEIGVSGDSGSAEGVPHLHFEVEIDGKKVDPESVLPGVGVGAGPAPLQGQEMPLVGALRLRLRSGFDFLNVRAGPGLEFVVVDTLKPGEMVEVDAIGGNNAWVQLVDGRGWVAVTCAGVGYLEDATFPFPLRPSFEVKA